jgi:hypothetical protein
MRRRITEQLAAPGRAEDRLKRVARGYFDAARGRSQLMRFHNPPDGLPASDIIRFYETVVAQVGEVEEGIAKGELSPGPIRVRMLVFMGALGEALCGHVLLVRPDLMPALADSIVETVLSGWVPGKGRPS